MNRNKFLLNKIYKLAQSNLDAEEKNIKIIDEYETRSENILKFFEDYLQHAQANYPARNHTQYLQALFDFLKNKKGTEISPSERPAFIEKLKEIENTLSSLPKILSTDLVNLKAQVDYLFFSPEGGKSAPQPTPTPSPKKPSPQEYFNNLIGAVNGKVNKYKNEYSKNFEAAEYIPDAVKQEFDNLDKNAIKELNRIFTSTSNENVKNTIRTAIKNLKDNISSEIIAAMPNLHFSAVDVAPTNYIKSTEPEELSWKDFTGPKTLRVNQP